MTDHQRIDWDDPQAQQNCLLGYQRCPYIVFSFRSLYGLQLNIITSREAHPFNGAPLAVVLQLCPCAQCSDEYASLTVL